jgi:hypothetical protein
MHHDHFRRGDDLAHGREARERIIGDLGFDDGLNDQVLIGKKDRVAICRRLRRRGGADRAAGAGEVLDIELTAEALRQLLRHDARDRVARTAGRIG